MNIKSMYENIQIQMGEAISFAEFFSAMTRIVKLCNLQAEKLKTMLTITGTTAWEYTIGDTDDDDHAIGDTADDRVIGDSRWSEGVTWDSLNNVVELPSNVTKVIALWYAGEKCHSEPYDLMKTMVMEDLVYTCIGRRLYFPESLDAQTTEIRVKVETKYPDPSRTDTEYTGMPETAESMLMNGILNVLYTQPKHFNTTQFGIYRTAFNNDLANYNDQILTQEPQEHQVPVYTY